MPLKSTDLEQWMSDPEEWVNNEDKENDLWEYEIRVGLSTFIPSGAPDSTFAEHSISLAVKEF
jgi:hypothetical protein